MPNNYSTNTISNDIESRIAKLERQINRLDYRVSKLESIGNVIPSTDDYEVNNTNMYMI